MAYKYFKNINSLTGGYSSDIIDIKDLNIPSEYPDDSPIIDINKKYPNAINDILETSEKFNANNAKLNLKKDNIDKGIINITTNNGDKYELKIVPVIELNLTDSILCWSWVKSLFDKIPYYIDLIKKFKDSMKKYLDSISYFNFDCVKYLDEDKLFVNLMDDILIVVKDVLNAKGFIHYMYLLNDNTEIKSMAFITDIKKINKQARSNDVIDIRDLNIPDKYTNNTMIEIQKQNSNTIDNFWKTVKKFENAEIHFSGAHKGIYSAIINNDKYDFKIVPVITYNLTDKIICWSWIKSYLLRNPHYKKIIQKFRKDMQQYIDSIDYLKFDCVKITNNDKFNKLMDDIVLVAKHVLDAKGFITSFRGSNKEFLFITDIKKRKNI